MSHRTYRHVDTPVPYLGLTWRQWLLIVSCAAVALTIIHLLHPPTPIALWLGTVLLTAPVAVSYFTSGATVSFGQLLLDHARWMLAPRELSPSSTVARVAARGFFVGSSAPRARLPRPARSPMSERAVASSGDLLPLEALSADGVGVLRSGALARWIEVSPVNPLIHDFDSAETIARTFSSIAARLPDDRQSIQFIAQGTPLPVDAILTAEWDDCAAAADAARARGWETLGVAIERLGLAREQSIRTQSEALAALDLRYFVVVPWHPASERTRIRMKARSSAPINLQLADYERAMRESRRHAEGIRTDLESIGLSAQELDGFQVAELMWRRFAPERSDAGIALDPALRLPDRLDELTDPETARTHAIELRRVLCPESIDLRDKTVVRIGRHVEQARYVGTLPEQTWLGWLLYLMSAHYPFTVATHVHATDRTRERLFHKRRYRRIHGNNRGTEMKGRPLDPDQQAQESEAADLNAELALTGAGVYRVANYLAVREPGGDQEALAEVIDSIGRELAGANEAHLHPGVAAQRDVLGSTVAHGVDLARRTRKYVSMNVGDTTPLVGARCGSPKGIPIGYSSVGRTLERLDLFDAAHSNHMLVITGESGFGKTMLVNNIYCRALARGDQGAVIERGGHYEFLASLIPGAANVSLGTGADAICPWDTPDCASVGSEKIDYLIALHATLIGTGRRDEYGLSALEENLLGRAIRHVYERCVVTDERPRELLLQEALTARAAAEMEVGAGQMADALRDLAARLHNFCGDGPYAYLADKETTVPQEAPLVVFDTRRIPAHFAGAAMFEIVEHVAERVARSAKRHLQEYGDRGAPGVQRRAPRYYLTLEEVWKLLEHEATARWVNELPRRSRHDNLGLIGVSQQLSDFNNPWGRAFIDNSARKLSFHQSPRQIGFLKDEMGLTDDEVQAIGQLKTIKRDYSTAYFDNGPRGRGTITSRYADLEYWICTHEPEFDEPIRRQALNDAGDDPWRALRLLADPEWHEGLIGRAA